ncbi:conserved transmembrane domain protein [Mycobacterium xenopi 3993]|nr:conserved transmembrane domain protein [Mycobacterium xenopi 3993]
MTSGTDREPKRLFYEPGASWYWVLVGPVTAVAMLFIEKSAGYGWNVLVPMVFLVLVSGFLAIQVKAARIHTSVELTEDTLRQGTETIKVAEIVKVYPEAEHAPDSGLPLHRWQSARASASWSACRAAGWASVSSSPTAAPRKLGRGGTATCEPRSPRWSRSGSDRTCPTMLRITATTPGRSGECSHSRHCGNRAGLRRVAGLRAELVARPSPGTGRAGRRRAARHHVGGLRSSAAVADAAAGHRRRGVGRGRHRPTAASAARRRITTNSVQRPAKARSASAPITGTSVRAYSMVTWLSSR